MKIVSGVYRIRSLVDGKIYVGSSRDMRKRFISHLNLLRTGKHHNQYLQNAFNKHGESNFVFEIIESVDPNLLLDKESEWIDKLRATDKVAGYNISKDPSSPMLGLTHSDESKQRMAQSQTGKKHSENTKIKISQAHLGAKFTKEHCEKISKSKLGRPLKESTKKLLTEIRNTDEWKKEKSRLGKLQDHSKWLSRESIEKRTITRSGIFIVTNPQGESFQIRGLASFCREHDLDQGSMTKVAQGKRNTCHGWTCQKVTV